MYVWGVVANQLFFPRPTCSSTLKPGGGGGGLVASDLLRQDLEEQIKEEAPTDCCGRGYTVVGNVFLVCVCGVVVAQSDFSRKLYPSGE